MAWTTDLHRAFLETAHDAKARVKRVADWIKVAQWEIAADPAYVCTVWHPYAAPDLVKKASLWKVINIDAPDVASAFSQLPGRFAIRLKKPGCASNSLAPASAQFPPLEQSLTVPKRFGRIMILTHFFNSAAT